jgi:hypothetical protein
MKRRSKSRPPTGLPRLSAWLLLPFLVLHLGFVTPIVEWMCLCPADEPGFSCCCNCPKCVERRGGFKSYCGLHSGVAGSPVLPSVAIRDKSQEKSENTGHKFPEFSVETLHCHNEGYIKKISLDFTPFIPAIKLNTALLLPIYTVFQGENGLPPAVFLHQRDKPG